MKIQNYVMPKANQNLRNGICNVLRLSIPRLLTCKEIASLLPIHASATQVYNCIRNMPLQWKQQLKIQYGASLFFPNRYGL